MRKSRQRGWIELRGKKWYGYFRKTVIDPTTNEQRSLAQLRALTCGGLREEVRRMENGIHYRTLAQSVSAG
jgi:hypothetical protein